MRIILSSLAATVILVACSGNAAEKKSLPSNDFVPVKLLPISEANSQVTVQASGLLATENEARLAFKIGGVIDQVFVKEGDIIKKGQLLATLKSTEIAAQVQQVTLAVEKAERDYKRAANLYRDSVATLEQLQNAKTGAEIARQNLQQVSFNEQFSRIYAPADGFLVKKLANAGEQASPGAPILFMNASSLSSKWILKLGLSDQDWAGVHTGNPATVSIDAFPGKSFKGYVSKKALAADPVSGAFAVEVQVQIDGEQPAVGMFGNAVIQTSTSADGYSIGYEALLEANGKKGFVFVSDDQKTVRKVEVSIASINDNTVYISEGLEGHKYVVISGSPYLDEHSSISVIK